jgi:hypothetical protein
MSGTPCEVPVPRRVIAISGCFFIQLFKVCKGKKNVAAKFYQNFTAIDLLLQKKIEWPIYILYPIF